MGNDRIGMMLAPCALGGGERRLGLRRRADGCRPSRARIIFDALLPGLTPWAKSCIALRARGRRAGRPPDSRQDADATLPTGAAPPGLGSFLMPYSQGSRPGLKAVCRPSGSAPARSREVTAWGPRLKARSYVALQAYGRARSSVAVQA